MIHDLHSHTYYSFCGENTPERILDAAIAGGLEMFGISDHQYIQAKSITHFIIHNDR